MLFSAIASVHAQSVNDGFSPHPDGTVLTVAVQADGKLVVGGVFLSVGGESHNAIARFNADGRLDPDFIDPHVSGGSVYAVTVQTDGKLLLSGSFTMVDGMSGYSYVARLNADGTLDRGFNPHVTGGTVDALALQPDGKLVLGGSFSAINGTPRNGSARLKSTGNLDFTFNPPNISGGTVDALVVQPDGAVVLGGGFTSIGGVARNRIARLTPNGTLDLTFDPNANADVYALTLQADGKLLLGGGFTAFGSGTTVITRNRVARLNANGSVDATFLDLNADAAVYTLLLQPDGKLVLGGSFIAMGGMSRNRMARLNPDGHVDAGFNPNVGGGGVYALALQADDNLVLAGSFLSVADTARYSLARLYPDGSLDATSSLNVNGNVYALTVQADGKLVLGGFFSTIGGVSHRSSIARLYPDGSLDALFNPDVNSAVYALAVQPDGKLVLGGSFTAVNGIPHNSLARLNPDGSLDDSFSPDVNGTVDALAVQADGGLVLGGSFSVIDGMNRRHIARLDSAGHLDPTFDPNANSGVYALAVQANGQLVVGGSFTTIAEPPRGFGDPPITRNHIARLNADGSLDTTFDPIAKNGDVVALIVQANGQIVLGGGFTSVAGMPRNCIARLNADGSLDALFNPDPGPTGYVYALAAQADGKLVLGGNFTAIGPIGRNHIARLNPQGDLDLLFNPNANGYVNALALQADGKLVLGGSFTTVSDPPISRSYLARLNHPQAALQSLRFSANTVTWSRSGASPELAWPPQLSVSLDGNTYSPLGLMNRLADGSGWSYGGFTLPSEAGGTFYIRAQGQLSSGGSNGSQGVIESTRQVYIDRIFTDSFEIRP